MRINYDFADLEAFMAVMETGSFHGAAEQLNLSQSAVTRRVQKLETALDTLLFERSTRSVKASLAAKRLRPRAEAMLEQASETSAAMRDESLATARQRRSLIKLAVIPTVLSSLVPRAVQALERDFPGLRLQVLDYAANEVSELVASGEADLGLTSLPALEANTQFELLFEDPMVVAMPADHALARSPSLTWDQLAGQGLILPARKTGNRALIDEACAKAGIILDWRIETERTSTALDCVAGGLGIALLPRSAIGADTKRLVFRPMTNPTITRAVGLLSRLGQIDSPQVAALKVAIRGKL